MPGTLGGQTRRSGIRKNSAQTRDDAMKRKRDAFTLVEMLIVLAIVALLAALIAFTLPGFQERSRAAKGGAAIQGWLNYARQRAQYEQAPRGMRFWVQESVEYSGLTPTFNVVYKAQYLEKPDDFHVSDKSISAGNRLNADDLTSVRIHEAANPNTGFHVGDGTVEKGDYLELLGTGQVYRIFDIRPSDTNFPTILDQLVLDPNGPLPEKITTPIKDYRIIRRPRVAGDEPLTLPENVVIDITSATTYQASGYYLPNVPAGQTYFDILFAPSGNVLDYDRDKIVLWVRVEDDDTGSEFLKNPTLLVVYANTGAVAAYAPATAADPYASIQK